LESNNALSGKSDGHSTAGPNQFEDATISHLKKRMDILLKEGNETPQPRNSRQNTSDTIVDVLKTYVWFPTGIRKATEFNSSRKPTGGD
jgi:hypothetical protein